MKYISGKVGAFLTMLVALSVVGMGTAVGVQSNLFYPFLNTSNFAAAGRLDAFGNILGAKGGTVQLNITSSSVVKASAGYVVMVSIVSAPSTAVSIYDAPTLASASSVNKLANLTSAAGLTVQDIELNTVSGIVVDPGTNGVVAIKYQ